MATRGRNRTVAAPASATDENLMTLMSTCEAVIIAKNEENDALKQAIELRDGAIAEKNKLIHELATLLVDREQKLAVAIKDIEDVSRQHDKAVTSGDLHLTCPTPSPTASSLKFF